MNTRLLALLLSLSSAAFAAELPPGVDLDAAAERLGAAIRFPTIAHPDPQKVDLAAFRGLHAWLGETYPRVHAAMDLKVVDDLALLYTWTGEDPSLPPVLLAAHMDVVPVEEGTEASWPHPPFSGVVADGAIWGRGALDDKMAVLGILEAAEAKLSQGWRPKRTLIFAFGGDEEVNGSRGAREIAQRLGEDGVHPMMVLDEGLVVTEGIVPGVAAPVALIGVSEKGSVSLELVIEGAGGHSSMPPPSTAVGRIAAAIVKLEQNPMPAELSPPTTLMLDAVAPHAEGALGLLFGNLWMSKGLVLNAFTEKPSTNASVRTTMAATMFEGGPKDNVLPASARAVVNFRIHPRDRVADVIAHVVSTIDDPDIQVRPIPSSFASEPSPLSPHAGPAWDILVDSVRATFPDAVVAPSLVVGATDARHYVPICENVYRFAPIRLNSEDLKRLHGASERIPVANYGEVITFYAEFITRAGER